MRLYDMIVLYIQGLFRMGSQSVSWLLWIWAELRPDQRCMDKKKRWIPVKRSLSSHQTFEPLGNSMKSFSYIIVTPAAVNSGWLDHAASKKQPSKKKN